MQSEFGDPDSPEDDEEDVSEDDGLELDEEEDAEEDDGTVAFSSGKSTDNVGDVSVEINVEELIAELEASEDSAAARKKEVRRRLEEIWEQREARKELEDTFSFDLNDDD